MNNIKKKINKENKILNFVILSFLSSSIIGLICCILSVGKYIDIIYVQILGVISLIFLILMIIYMSKSIKRK